ncbi:MAG TPA: hypothetical protein VEV20_12545, partial [Burkholderiales bacterium]|nr:hypothetical protein [Burkholderiales bacterium]
MHKRSAGKNFPLARVVDCARIALFLGGRVAEESRALQPKEDARKSPKKSIARLNPAATFMQIGPHTLRNNLVVTPMAGVTDRPFRQLCKLLGAGM